MTSLYQLLPVLAAVLFGLAAAAAVVRPTVAWSVPALVAALFLGWSLYTIAAEGLAGVWTEHTGNAWGNQIWFDLLIAIAIAWALLLPRARAVSMRPWPWLAVICATGCIGLAAMFARCLYLETRQTT